MEVDKVTTIRPDYLIRFPLQFYLNLRALELSDIKNILNRCYDQVEGGNLLHLLCYITGELKYSSDYYFYGKDYKIDQGLAILIAHEMKNKGVNFEQLNYANQTPLQSLKNPLFPLERRRNNDIFINIIEILNYFD